MLRLREHQRFHERLLAGFEISEQRIAPARAQVALGPRVQRPRRAPSRVRPAHRRENFIERPVEHQHECRGIRERSVHAFDAQQSFPAHANLATPGA